MPAPGGPVKPTMDACRSSDRPRGRAPSRLGIVVLDERDRPRERALVACQEALGEGPPRSAGGCRRGNRCRHVAAPWSARVAVTIGHGRMAPLSLPRCRPAARRRRPAPLWHGPPPPLHGGLLTLLRFMRRNRMLNRHYARLLLRLGWLKLRFRGRLHDRRHRVRLPGRAFRDRPRRRRAPRPLVVARARDARSAPRGRGRVGAKSVLGQECTISAFQHVSIGRECIIADRCMLIDFDHGIVEVERPIRAQGIYTARRPRRQQLLDRLRRLRPARRPRRRQQRRRHLVVIPRNVPDERGRRRRARRGHPHARAAAELRWT